MVLRELCYLRGPWVWSFWARFWAGIVFTKMGTATIKTNTKLPTFYPAYSVILWNQEVQSRLVLLPSSLATLPTRQQKPGRGVVKRLLPTQRFSPDLTRPAKQDLQKPILPSPPPEWLSPAQDLSLLLKTHQFPCNNFLGPVVFQWNFKNKNLGSLHHGSSNV